MPDSFHRPPSLRRKRSRGTNESHSSNLSHIPDQNNSMPTANELSLAQLEARLTCCCGRADCAYLEQNNTALGDIEKDLEKAARLGQALLSRHESYITESQTEYARLNSQIESLEADRTSLQHANEKIVAENKVLLSQLENLNAVYANSNSHVKNLEDLLKDCEAEVKRLHGLARRAELLEVQILEMDKQKEFFTRQIDDGKHEARSMLLRWRESEQKVKELEMDIQKIEWEAKQEREKHEDAIARLQQRQPLDAGPELPREQLQSTNILHDLSQPGPTTNVVSHFVRDILQDNANLQAGIVELRELLQTSNEEVQNLRTQIMQHQPISQDRHDELHVRPRPLDEDLGWTESPSKAAEQQVHVHHHYHAKLAPKRDRATLVRRGSRKRAGVAPGLLASTPESSMPSTPRAQRYSSSPVASLSLRQSQMNKNRWSMQSAATGSSTLSSLPSSPRSHYERQSSIFDRLEMGEDSSRPTSPESNVGYHIPTWRSHGSRQLKPDDRFNTFEEAFEDRNPAVTTFPDESTPTVEKDDAASMLRIVEDDATPTDLTPKPSQTLLPATSRLTVSDKTDPQSSDILSKPPVYINSTEQSMSTAQLRSLDDAPPTVPSTTIFDPFSTPYRPSLVRSSSHESLVSISGMDIHLHTSKRSTPLALLRGNSAHFARSPYSISRNLSAAAQPLAKVTEFTAISSSGDLARNALGRKISDTPARGISTSVQALSGIAGLTLPSAANNSYSTTLPRRMSSSNGSETRQQQEQQTGGLSWLVGGWAKGKWGVVAVKTASDPPVQSTATSQPEQTPTTSVTTPVSITAPNPSPSQTSHPSGPRSNPPSNRPSVPGTYSNSYLHNSIGRSPGINQQGAIPGLWTIPSRAPSELVPKVLDEEGLREGLGE